MEQNSARINQSAEKVLQVIEAMAHGTEALRLRDIALKTDLPDSTALRMLQTLIAAGYVQQDPATLRYSLTMKISLLGSLVGSRIDIRKVARPYMEKLARKCQMSVCLAIDSDMEAMYIDVEESPDGLIKVSHRIGQRTPLHSTASGKVFLLGYSARQIDQFIARKGLTVYTPKTISTREELLAEMEKIRQSGYAVNDEEAVPGVRCVGVPIYNNTNAVVASISASSTIFTTPPERMIATAAILKEYGALISKELGYLPENPAAKEAALSRADGDQKKAEAAFADGAVKEDIYGVSR